LSTENKGTKRDELRRSERRIKAGTAAIEAMLAADAEQFCGKRYQRHADRQGYRWGMIGSEVGWHGGQAAIRRPRVRERGAEVELPSWRAIQNADLLSRWAFNQMLIGVATRKYARSIRLPDGEDRRCTDQIVGLINGFEGCFKMRVREWTSIATPPSASPSCP
jgi:hypothetical protein